MEPTTKSDRTLDSEDRQGSPRRCELCPPNARKFSHTTEEHLKRLKEAKERSILAEGDRTGVRISRQLKEYHKIRKDSRGRS